MVPDDEGGDIQRRDPDTTEAVDLNGHQLLTEYSSIEDDSGMLPGTSLQSHYAQHSTGGSGATSLPDIPEMGVFGIDDEDFDFMSGLWQLPLTVCNLQT